MGVSKKKSFIVPWHIFPFDVLVCLGLNREDVMRKIGNHYDLSEEEKENLHMYGTGRTVMLEGGQTILWLKNYPRPGSGVLVHEIYHAKDFILDKIGIKMSSDCDELGAYMVEYLNNEIVKKL